MTRQAPAAPENVIWGLDGEVTCMNAAQNEKASRFRALHDGLGAFVIPNPWDVGSARILTGLGFQALATSSGASACALGRRNHGLTRDEALAHARPIVDATDLPVSSRLVFIEMASGRITRCRVRSLSEHTPARSGFGRNPHVSQIQ